MDIAQSAPHWSHQHGSVMDFLRYLGIEEQLAYGTSNEAYTISVTDQNSSYTDVKNNL